jgi:Uma2 family endonuclease
MVVPAPAPFPSVPAGHLRRLTVAQYDAMGRAGILGEDDQVELLEGWLVEKMTKNPRHRIATRAVRVALERLMSGAWYVESQEPIVTADSEPEPDAAIVRGRTEDYVTSNPPASAVGLVVEIADTSLARDREIKARIYARARIPTYWIVDLNARRVEVYTEPSGEGDSAAYSVRRDLGEGERIVLVLEGVEVGSVDVTELVA